MSVEYTNEYEQMEREIVNVGEPHLPCVLLLDVSGSMEEREKIKKLNEAVRLFYETLKKDPLAMGRVEISLVTFGTNVKVIAPFVPAENFKVPELSAYGMTAMNEAICFALDETDQRKRDYQAEHMKYFQPWIFLLTDGYPTDDNNGDYLERAIREVKERTQQKKLNFIPMAIGDGDTSNLKRYTDGGVVLKATEQNFQDAFVWLSQSLTIGSNSHPGQDVVSPELPRTVTFC